MSPLHAWWIRYRSLLAVVMVSAIVAGSFLFVGATFFAQTDHAKTKATTAVSTAKRVQKRAVSNAKTIKTERRRNRTLERVVIRAGLAKRGPNGKLGPAGPPGKRGATGAQGPAGTVDYARLARVMARSLTDTEITRLAAEICATHACHGMPGADGKDAQVTDADLERIADRICGGSAPCPPKDGAQGPPGTAGTPGATGPAVGAFGFFPPSVADPSMRYTCTDPDGDLTYDCVPG